MIPFIPYAGISNNNHAINLLVSLIDEDINSTRDIVGNFNLERNLLENFNFNSTESCGTLFDISKFIPQWVVVEKYNREANLQSTTTIYDFIQKYYDWLYCDAPGGANYSLSKNILDLIDIRKTKDNLIENIYKMYAGSFDDLFTSDLNIARNQLENFLVNIRRTFYHKKGTEEAAKKLLTTLFLIDEEDIQIEIPKDHLLRLNGGRFYSENFNFNITTGLTGNYLSRGDLAGSYLNGSRLQDGNWFHNHSYILYTGPEYSNNEDLERLYKKSNHPAGIKLVFGKQISDYVSPAPTDEDVTTCEYPLLSNYAPYIMGSIYPNIGQENGFSYAGIDSCVGCCGALYSGFTGPTHVFPTWTQNIISNTFFDINILDFLTLCYDSGLTSPNEDLTCDGC